MNLLRATGVLAVGLLGLLLVHPAPGAGQATTSCEDVGLSSPFETLLRCAQQGLADAQTNLGIMYFKGEGVPQDDSEAVRWLRLAADQEVALAQFILGYMYDNGEGVPEDDAEAVRWFRLAADQGHASAQYNLGYMYAAGEGVPEDLVLAYMWFNLSAAQGNEGAQDNKEIIAPRMTCEQIGEVQRMSREWLEAHR